IERITLAEARAYFETYYAPNNATLVLVGDFDSPAALRLVEGYFGPLPRRTPAPPVIAAEPPQDGERRAIVRKQAELPSVLVGYHGVRAIDPDRPVLDVIERLVAGGDSARLQEDLIRKNEVATEVESDNEWGIDPELFWIYAQARPGKTAADVERRIDRVIESLAREDVPQGELRKAKNQLRAEFVRGLKTGT